jgi:hypothetical protein
MESGMHQTSRRVGGGGGRHPEGVRAAKITREAAVATCRNATAMPRTAERMRRASPFIPRETHCQRPVATSP